MPQAKRYPVLLQLKTRQQQARRLRRLAEREDMTMSALMRRALDRYLDQEEQLHEERGVHAHAAG